MHEDLRSRNLRDVLGVLGFSEWKERKGGTEWFGACPIHGPKANRGSFSFDREGRYHCFSCRVHGKGAIDLVMAVRKVGFHEAVEWLKGLSLQPEIRLSTPSGAIVNPLTTEVCGDPACKDSLIAQNPPFKGTYDKFAVESAWLKNRGFTPETLTRYGVFQYENAKRRSAYSGSVMLKIRRYSDGECVGYLSRNIGDVTAEKPKYLLPRGLQKSLELFGAIQLKEKAPHRVVFIVESPFTVMAFNQHGFAAVSPFGWSVSQEQANILSSLARGVVYLPDRNKQSERIAVAGLLSQFLWVKSPELPEGVSDPEQLRPEQIRALMT